MLIVILADFGISAIIMSAIAAAMAIAGGAVSGAQANKAELNAQTQKAKNDSWFNNQYGQALEKRDNKDALEAAAEMLNKNTTEQRGVANILGTSPEIASAATNMANRQYGVQANKIVSENSANMNKAEQTYTSRDNEINKQLQDAKAAKASAWENVTSGLASASASMAGAFNSGAVATNGTTAATPATGTGTAAATQQA